MIHSADACAESVYLHPDGEGCKDELAVFF